MGLGVIGCETEAERSGLEAPSSEFSLVSFSAALPQREQGQDQDQVQVQDQVQASHRVSHPASYSASSNRRPTTHSREQDESEGPVCDEGSAQSLCAADADRYYHHPLQGLQPLPDGRYPFIDVQETPEGKVYALSESFHGDDENDPEGKVHHFGGVVELEVRPMTEEELASKTPAKETPLRTDKLDRALRDKLEDLEVQIQEKSRLEGLSIEEARVALGADEAFLVSINLTRTRHDTLTQRLDRAIVEGYIQNHADRHAMRQAELIELADEIADHTQPVVDYIRSMGGEVTFICQYSPCLTAKLRPDMISDLEARSKVRRMGTLGHSSPDTMNGIEKAEINQTKLFWDETFTQGGYTWDFTGNNGTVTDIHAAILDNEGFRHTHRAFYENSGSTSRIAGKWDCQTPPCSSVSSFGGGHTHGTAVAGTVMADTLNEQDPNITNFFEQRRHNAPAREAKAYLFHASREQSDQKAVYDKAAGLNPAPHVLVSSNSVGSPGVCSGEETKAIDADGVYEAGIAYFKSVNQGGGGSATDCTVGRPGEAIGVIAVGGYDPPSGTETSGWCARKSAPVHASQNWGGNFVEGKGRTIVDVLGPYMGQKVPWKTSDTSYGTMTGTSHATPFVASAAIAFIDMMKNERNTNIIDDPGFLHAWMLNMGDRRDPNGNRMNSQYSNRTGAGNLKMRFLGPAGMDGGWHVNNYAICVGHQQVVTIPVPDPYNDASQFSSGVDSIRVTAWWYDRRIEDGIQIDDIDLKLKTSSGNTLQVSNDSYDEKERVYYTGISANDYTKLNLEVHGYNVSADNAGCGTNGMRVYLSYIAEDEARNDPNGPSYNPTTCEGVEPL